MKRTTAIVIVLFSGLMASGALAQDDGIDPMVPGSPLPTEPPDTGYIEGWNDDQPYSPAGLYFGNCFGYLYTPVQSYTLERVEFYAGGREGIVTISILEDDGTEFPTGALLAFVIYTESAEPAWQGENLDQPILVEEGESYYIRYEVVVGADVSTAATGTIIPHTWSDDGCGTWGDWWPTQYWMTRFYGELPTPAEHTAWGNIKTLYRE